MSLRPATHIAFSERSASALPRRLLALCLLAPAITASAGELRARVVDQDGKPLIDAVVVAKALAPGNAAHPRPAEALVDQIDKEFVPRVKPVFVGSRVRFPNNDNVRHQVYSFSAAKKFELPLYAGSTAAPTVVFDTPGVVALGCNIHDWMIAYIYVSDSPYFAKTGKDGTALLIDLPAGDYNVRVWQPSMGEREHATAKRVTLGGGGRSEVEWRITVKPTFRIRRAPSPGGSAYR